MFLIKNFINVFLTNQLVILEINNYNDFKNLTLTNINIHSDYKIYIMIFTNIDYKNYTKDEITSKFVEIEKNTLIERLNEIINYQNWYEKSLRFGNDVFKKYSELRFFQVESSYGTNIEDFIEAFNDVYDYYKDINDVNQLSKLYFVVTGCDHYSEYLDYCEKNDIKLTLQDRIDHLMELIKTYENSIKNATDMVNSLKLKLTCNDFKLKNYLIVKNEIEEKIENTEFKIDILDDGLRELLNEQIDCEDDDAEFERLRLKISKLNVNRSCSLYNDLMSSIKLSILELIKVEYISLINSSICVKIKDENKIYYDKFNPTRIDEIDKFFNDINMIINTKDDYKKIYEITKRKFQKKCNICKNYKFYNCFGIDKSRKDKFHNNCNNCR